jgi:hypothetical protein
VIVFDKPIRRDFRGQSRLTSHLCSTLPGAEGTYELIEFACGKLGMHSAWLQEPAGRPEHVHFDLIGERAIIAAEMAGAKLVTMREIAAIWNAKREGREHALPRTLPTLPQAGESADADD